MPLANHLKSKIFAVFHDQNPIQLNNHMKKLSIAVLFVSSLAISACHYGQDEAGKTIERNDQYKNEKQDFSVNRAGEGGKANTQVAPSKEDSTVIIEKEKSK